jgi:hypothetical protein
LTWPQKAAIDVRALGKTLYASLTGAWPVFDDDPLQTSYGLPLAPRASNELLPPRHVNPSVSEMLNTICMRILQPGPTEPALGTVAQIANSLQGVLGAADASEDLAARVLWLSQSYADRDKEPQPGEVPMATVVTTDESGTLHTKSLGLDAQDLASFEQDPMEATGNLALRPTAADLAASSGSLPVSDSMPMSSGALPVSSDVVPELDEDAELLTGLVSMTPSEEIPTTQHPVVSSAETPDQPPVPAEPPVFENLWGTTAQPAKSTDILGKIKAAFSGLTSRFQGFGAPIRWIILAVLVALVVLLLFGVRSCLRTDEVQPVETPAPTVDSKPLAIAGALDFDPVADGGDAAESSDLVPASYDGDPATFWESRIYACYLNTPACAFPDMDKETKPGLGLLFDLGTEKQVTSVDLSLLGSDYNATGTPANVRLLVPAANPGAEAAPMATVNDWSVVGEQELTAPETNVPLSSPTSTRWVLVYFTTLPQSVSSIQYQLKLSEVVIFGLE